MSNVVFSVSFYEVKPHKSLQKNRYTVMADSKVPVGEDMPYGIAVFQNDFQNRIQNIDLTVHRYIIQF